MFAAYGRILGDRLTGAVSKSCEIVIDQAKAPDHHPIWPIKQSQQFGMAASRWPCRRSCWHGVYVVIAIDGIDV